MGTLAGLPFVALQVDRTGARIGGDAWALPSDISDLLVISHGWKNDASDARTLYETLIANVRQAAGDAFAADGRRFGVVGLFWPAFRFLPDLSLLPDGAEGGGAGGAAAAGDDDVPWDELAAYAAQIAAELGAEPLTFAEAALAGARGGDPADSFLEQLRGLLSEADEHLLDDHRPLLCDRGSDLVADLKQGGTATAMSIGTDEGAGDIGDIGGAAFLGGFVERMRTWRAGGRAAIASIMNQATYFEMKARAGRVGAAVAALVAPPAGVRVHLIGHSFGARLVCALCVAPGAPRPTSLTLLQGAFSHNGLGAARRGPGSAERDGAFRRIVADHLVSGPIVVTHTHRDTAVGFFYAIASALSGEASAAWGLEQLVGGPKDKHGGIGANGARSLLDGEAESHVATLADGVVGLDGGAIAFAPGRIHNVRADAIIPGHNEVTGAAVASLVWASLG